MSNRSVVLCAFLLSGCLLPVRAEDTIDFNRDIRPLLSDRCLACHGPDDSVREGELRFDEPSRLQGGDNAVVIPGDSSSSVLLERITSDDPDLRMPPPDSEKHLSDAEIATLRRWIDEGAAWDEHWAWVPPQESDTVSSDAGPAAIDLFIRQRLAREGLSPSAEADRVTLIRRLSFDLVGLPPEWDDVAAFQADRSEDAWEKVVDRLLSSPHFGERMAVYWLDVVRYADSNGYHSDEPRQSAPYRDYVIDAFNQNKPYDTFIIEQLAGDLLADATVEQQVASGFNMLLQTTSEGGAQAKEYIAKYAADRVRNTSQIFLGSTLGCAECHNHKFDPFTARDFYQFAAFFADIEQPAVGNPPVHTVIRAGDQQELDRLDEQLRQARQRLAEFHSAEYVTQRAAWMQSLHQQLVSAPEPGPWYSLGPIRADSFDAAWEAADIDPAAVDLAQPHKGLSWQRQDGWADGHVHQFAAVDNANQYLFRTLRTNSAADVSVSLGSDDGVRLWVNGALVHENRINRGAAADQDAATIHLREGENSLLLRITNGAAGSGFYFRLRDADLPNDVADVLRKEEADRSAEERALVDRHYRSVSPLLTRQRAAVSQLEKARNDFVDALPKTLMTKTSQPKTVRLLNRGDWMDESGPIMEPAVPAFLGKLDPQGRRLNRLDLARWIASPDNPLTARVMVNRLWKLFFARGLATPLDDFGRQGTLPTHPELLDWLACEFRDSGYDVKHMVKLMVMSQTYRQSAVPTEDQRRIDPANLLYARQTRFRLDAEFVRDNALAISGLLVERIGGPSVYPYQPAGYWVHMNFPKRKWPGDEGEDLYRRGVYTWWQRMFLHPSLKAFDAPSREECTVERPRSNIPQQALVLLNDPTYVEAARGFARRILQEAPSSADADRLNWASRVALSRDLKPQETAVLHRVLSAARADYAGDESRAKELLTVGKVPADDVDSVQLAAWTAVARVILNLSETITRP